MTPEQLDEIEKLLLPGIPCGGQEGRYASALAKTVKALREAWNEIVVRASERDTSRAFAAHLQKELDAIKVSLDGYKTTVTALGRELQSHDCTHRDTPGLIHCPIDKPCSLHRIEQLRRHLGEIP